MRSISTARRSSSSRSVTPPRWLPEVRRRYFRQGGPTVEVTVLVQMADGQTKIKLPDGHAELVPSASVTSTRRFEPQWNNFVKLAEHRTGDSDTDFPRFLA